MTYPARTKQVAINLRKQGHSIKEITRKLNISKSTSSLWLRNIKLNALTRQRLEQRRKDNQFSPTRQPKKRNNQPRQSYHSGLSMRQVTQKMNLWGEGQKKENSHTVDLTNSDPLIIKLYCKFLRNIYQINETKLRAMIYGFSSQDINKLTLFWSNLTKIPQSQFTKPYIRHKEKHIHDKMKHGLIHVRYADKRLLRQVLKDIKNLAFNL